MERDIFVDLLAGNPDLVIRPVLSKLGIKREKDLIKDLREGVRSCVEDRGKVEVCVSRELTKDLEREGKIEDGLSKRQMVADTVDEIRRKI